MSRYFTVIFIVVSVLVGIILFSGLVWVNARYAEAQPVEKDFLVPWLAARTFIQYGDSPYSEEATRRAQVIYYGRLAVPGEDPLYLGTPFPLELFYFPFALLSDYALARGLWLAFSEAALVALAVLCLRLTGWRPGRWLFPLCLLASVFWAYGALTLAQSSRAGFAALALVAFLLALRSGRDELAGALLFFLPFSPLLTGVLLVFVVWWIVYHRRWRIVWGLLMTTAFLLAVSFLFLPDWFLPSLTGIIVRAAHNAGLSSMSAFASWSPVLGPRLGLALSVGLLLVLFIEWVGVLGADFRRLLWVISLVLAVTPLLGIPIPLPNYVVLFLPLTMLLSVLAERWSPPGRWGLVGTLLALVFAGSWLLYLVGLSTNPPGAPVLLFPALLVVGLYWTRWWALHPPRTTLENLP